MTIKPIKTEADYEKALAEIEHLFDAKPGTAKGDRLEVLTTLVEAYEEQHFPIPLPDPVEAIKYFLESRGLEQNDLAGFIERRQITPILNRKKPLSLETIRKLHTGLGIPADILIQPYTLAGRT